MTARRLALAGTVGLIGLWIVWGLLATGHESPIALIAITTLPLAIWLRDLWRDRQGAFLGAGVVSLIYFIHGVGAYTDRAERIPATAEIALSLVLFAAVWLRFRKRRDF